MTMLDQALNDIPDEHIVEAGTYELAIRSVKEKESKSGNMQIVICLEFVSDANAKPIFEYLGYPTEDMDERMLANTFRRWKSFGAAFGFDGSTIAMLKEEILVNGTSRTGWAKVGIQVDDKGVYEDSNRVQKYLIND